MKLNVEELAREAGYEPFDLSVLQTFPVDLEKFARLIVERCAVECKGYWMVSGDEIAARLRQLLEDK